MKRPRVCLHLYLIQIDTRCNRRPVAIQAVPDARKAPALVGTGKAALYLLARYIEDLKENLCWARQAQQVIGDEQVVVDAVGVGREGARRRVDIID